MAKAKARTKKAPFKAAKKVTGKTATVAARPTRSAIGNRRVKKAPSPEVRLAVTAPVRVAPAPRPMSPARRMPMPVSADRPIAPVQLRQPSLSQRELPPYDDTK